MNPLSPRLQLLAALCLLAAAAFGIDWPTTDSPADNSFGQNDAGRVSVGMTFAAQGTVRTADAGEVLFVAPEDRGVGDFPQPLGQWIAVDHGGNILGIYGRLSGLDRGSAGTSIVEKGAILGNAGLTGWASEQGYYYALYDRAEHQWVNPSMISSVRTDTKAPIIKAVTLVSREGQAFPLGSTKNLRQGAYRIVVEAYDAENHSPQRLLAPQRLSCVLNGTEVGSLHLETVKTVDGLLTVSAQTPTAAAKIYQKSGGYDLGEAKLTRGRVTLEIIARDAVGNEKSSTYGLLVE